jgi:hypothetical protein
MNTISKAFCLILLTFGWVKQVEATSLDVLEEQAQREVVDYMNDHNLSIVHGPAILSGSFKQIVLTATFLEDGRYRTATFVIDATWKEGRLPIKSVKIQ